MPSRNKDRLTAPMWANLREQPRITNRAESGPIFTFYRGKNTPERKDYIMDKLVVPVEERIGLC